MYIIYLFINDIHKVMCRDTYSLEIVLVWLDIELFLDNKKYFVFNDRKLTITINTVMIIVLLTRTVLVLVKFILHPQISIAKARSMVHILQSYSIIRTIHSS